MESILQILAQEINVQEVRKQLQDFKIQFETLKNLILESENKLKDFSFDEEVFLQVENQFNTLENELKTANNSVVKIFSEIERADIINN